MKIRIIIQMKIMKKKNESATHRENDEENKKKKSQILNNNKKKVYKYIPIFDLSDLENNYPEIKEDELEITKVLLRNLTGINKLYNYLNKIAKIN